MIRPPPEAQGPGNLPPKTGMFTWVTRSKRILAEGHFEASPTRKSPALQVSSDLGLGLADHRLGKVDTANSGPGKLAGEIGASPRRSCSRDQAPVPVSPRGVEPGGESGQMPGEPAAVRSSQPAAARVEETTDRLSGSAARPEATAAGDDGLADQDRLCGRLRFGTAPPDHYKGKSIDWRR